MLLLRYEITQLVLIEHLRKLQQAVGQLNTDWLRSS